MNIKKNMNNLEVKLNENDNSMKWFVNNNKEEINRIKTDANNEKKIIIDKYENILVQNKNSIKDIGNKLDNILIDFQNEKKGYLNELVLLYKYIINIINCYKKVFLGNCSVFVNKEKFDKILIKEEKDINPITFPLLYQELGKIGYGHFQLNNKKSRPKKKEIKSKYYKNIIEDIKIDDDDENNKKEKSNINYMKKNQRDKKIYKIIDIVKNEINNENSLYKNMLPISNDIIEKKTQIFSSIQRKTDGQLITMSKADLKYFCNSNTEKIEEIEKFIHNYFEIGGNVDNFDPAKERIDEIQKKLKIINNRIKDLSNKYINNNKIFENGDKIIQKLRNENHLLRKKLYDKDMRNIYTNFSPTVPNNRTQKMSFNKTNNLFKLNVYNNNNYYNSILTTTSSNEVYNQLIKPNSTRLFSDINSTGGTNEKTEKMYNLTDNNFEFFKKRPISSINKINPYFLVAENI